MIAPRPENTPVRTLALILGDQLDADYPHTLGLDPQTDAILMVEVAEASTAPASHIQRTVLFLSAMRHHADTLRDAGWAVDYVRLTDPDNTQAFEGELARALQRHRPERVACIEPGSYWVLDRIRSACEQHSTALDITEDPHFLCDHEQFQVWASGRKQLTMEYFYRAQRKRLGILVDHAGQPEGGSWNYDADNRRSFKQAPTPPPVPCFDPDAITRRVISDVRKSLPDLPGRCDSFAWPVTRAQALEALADFIEHRLPAFGDFQDAMWHGQHTLYHSLLSPAINLKLLNPREVIAAAVRAYEDNHAPLNAVEGFVRQIVGWREFIRGIHHHEGPGYDQRNALEHHGSLPEFYWTADTDMRCMSDAITRVLDHAHGHHIERLMLTGNFALIAGIEPSAVNDWYLGMYTDAIDWVTAPNTVGMALHADGGVVGTKPYAASANYINKMSNYCKQCPYNPRQRVGEDACPFNVFYWDFLIRHQQRFASNHRMAMILKHVDRMPREERVEITSSAAHLRTSMGITTADAES